MLTYVKLAKYLSKINKIHEKICEHYERESQKLHM